MIDHSPKARLVVTITEFAMPVRPHQQAQGFCAQCGSTLTCESERLPTETHFHVGAFDQAELLEPTRHIFPEERLPWLHLGDA